MSVYKDKKTGKYTVFVRYDNWKGERKAHKKEGFKIQREAKEYEREFLLKKSRDIMMGFGDFIDKYLEDIKPSIKPTTYETKVNIIRTHIRPYLENKALSEISSADVMEWQNTILQKTDENGKGYAQTYLRTIQNQINAIFNHAVTFYELPNNPCAKLKKMGKHQADEMDFWTVDEFAEFVNAIKDKPMSYYAFEVLFWTGIRMGELRGLKRRDVDLENGRLMIRDNYQNVTGGAIDLSPKGKDYRLVYMPHFLVEELEEYFDSLLGLDDDSRIFEISKSGLHHELNRGCQKTGLKRITVHGFRHSSCAALISLGFSPFEISKRLGHKCSTITERYAHLYPSVQDNMSDALENMHKKIKGGE